MVPGSGTNPFRIPDPGVKKEPYPGSGSALNQSGSGSGGRVGRAPGMVADPVPDWTGWLIQRDTDPGYRDQDPRPIHLRAY
jgi:hypothetical protein